MLFNKKYKKEVDEWNILIKKKNPVYSIFNQLWKEMLEDII